MSPHHVASGNPESRISALEEQLEQLASVPRDFRQVRNRVTVLEGRVTALIAGNHSGETEQTRLPSNDGTQSKSAEQNGGRS